jgi:NAD(P)-dependent dehydrogenase (short-subunit alcohol dehydrogenase family)
MLSARAARHGLGGPKRLSAHQFGARLLEPGEVAVAIRWLRSERSCAMTGSVLRADDGRTT